MLVAIEVGQSLKGDDVVRTLNKLKLERGVPKGCSVITAASLPVMPWTCGPMRYTNSSLAQNIGQSTVFLLCSSHLRHSHARPSYSDGYQSWLALLNHSGCGLHKPLQWPGYSLPIVYLVWAFVVLGLYPLCKWFSGLKNRRRSWLLAYL